MYLLYQNIEIRTRDTRGEEPGFHRSNFTNAPTSREAMGDRCRLRELLETNRGGGVEVRGVNSRSEKIKPEVDIGA